MSTKKVGEVGQGCLDWIPFFKNHQNQLVVWVKAAIADTKNLFSQKTFFQEGRNKGQSPYIQNYRKFTEVTKDVLGKKFAFISYCSNPFILSIAFLTCLQTCMFVFGKKFRIYFILQQSLYIIHRFSDMSADVHVCVCVCV